MSRLRVNKLTNKNNDGAPEFIHGASVTGVVTATAFKGDGSELTGVSADTNILNSGVPSGSASSINFGNNISVDSVANGVASLSVSVPPGLSVKENGQTPIDAVSSLSFDPTGFTVTNSASGEAFVQNSAGVGINSTGTSIATNVNTLNFVGAGNTFAYDSANNTVNISIASGGGGGASLTTYDDQQISNESNWTGSSSYSVCLRAAGGTKGNSFFFAKLEYNSPSTDTRLRVYPFTVNRSTGAISWGSAQNVWYNSSGSGTSTTFFNDVAGTGSVFAGGHNQYPGYSSHKFGYSYFHVTESGSVSGSYSYTNADHGYNGGFSHLPTSETTGRMISAGYNANASSRAHYRTHSVSGSSISIGGLSSLGSDTSTSYGVSMICQPGVYQSGNQVVGMIYYRTSGSSYYVRTISANGNTSNHSVSGWSSNAKAFQMANGDVILYSTAHSPMRFTSYSSSSTMSSAKPFPGGTMYYSFSHMGLGNDEFILSIDNSSVIDFGKPLLKATLDATTGFNVTGVAEIPALTSVGMESSYTGMYPLYANESDSQPDKILFVRHNSNSIRAKVLDFPTFN
jgi:hypothetical protein